MKVDGKNIDLIQSNPSYNDKLELELVENESPHTTESSGLNSEEYILSPLEKSEQGF